MDHRVKNLFALSSSVVTLVEKAAPPDPAKDFVSPAEAAAKLGPAHARMHSLAVDCQRANPRLSYEAAYSRMYTEREPFHRGPFLARRR
jgi:hypothetical protein